MSLAGGRVCTCITINYPDGAAMCGERKYIQSCYTYAC